MSAGGRPRTLNYRAVKAMRRSGIPVPQIAAWYGVNKSAIYAALRRASPTPTREQRLDEALNEIYRTCNGDPETQNLADIAREALDA